MTVLATKERRLEEPPAPVVNVPGVEVDRLVPFVALGLVLAQTNIMTAAGVHIPWLSPASGIAAVLGIPILLLYIADVGNTAAPSERLATSVVVALLLLMGAGLAVNTILPHLGVPRPLDEVPVVLTVDGLCALLGVWAYRRHPSSFHLRLPAVGWRDCTVVGLAVSVVAIAVMGANRLNNGAGGGLTLFMLVLALVVFAVVISWRDQMHPGAIPVVIFCVSLALLLMTSLRGWYTTGHDVQREYRVFELTKTLGSWNISRFKDAYNACLSITILPAMIWRWTRVADPYVYKVFFQFLFAFCPVMAYRLATRVSSAGVALLATIFFVSFVTFFQDMPMLNRQEIAFLFLVAALLALFNTRLSIRGRQFFFGLFTVGMVLSHYSTTYVAIGVLGIAWGIRVAIPPLRMVLNRIGPRLAERIAPVTDQARGTYALRFSTLAFVVAVSFVWSTPITHTGKGLTHTLSSAIEGLRGGSHSGSKSSDASYNFLSTSKPSPVQRLAEYDKASLTATADGRAAGDFYDLQTIAKYPTPVVNDSQLPLTAVGRAIGRTGVNVASLNYTVRQASAKLLQLFIGLGLVVVLLARRKPLHPAPEFFFLAAASLIAVLLQVVLPVLSVDYGVLRAFQQALFVLDVFLVTGSLALIPRIAQRWRMLIGTVVALCFFASSTGIFTQTLGGYNPQLHLNNAGTYYDIYYVHPEEVAAIDWLRTRITPSEQRDVQSEIQTDRYTFTSFQKFVGVRTSNDIYPALVRRDSYVFLGYSTMHRGESTVPVSSDLITYHYPVAFLDDNKDLIYSSGGARVYR